MMNDQNEKISELMDDFISSDQHQSSLDDVLKDVNQKYTMRRYQMIGEVMRNELPDKIQLDFSADVMAKINQEPPLKVEQKILLQPKHESSWWSSLFKPVAGLAVAASVAVVAITAVQLQQPDANSPSEQIAKVDPAAQSINSARVEQLASLPVVSNAVKVSGLPSLSSTTTSGTSWKIKRGEPDMQNKLNSYLINHNEYSSSMHGIIPQVRVVGFDGQ